MKWLLACAVALALTTPARAEVDIEIVTSPGGITAWLVKEPAIPFTALEIRFGGGASLDRPGKRGAVNLMTGLLEEGTGDLDARGFATATEALAAQFDFDVSDDAVSISARFLSENRDQAMALLRGALVQPNFAQADIDRVRGQVLSVIRSDQTDPNEIAAARFDALIFGDHPYGSSRDGTIDSVTALTRDDIVQAHRDVLARDRVFVGAAGDITSEELGLLLDALLGDLPDTGAPMPEPVEVRAPGGVLVVPFDTPQSVAMFGHEGFARDDPDFFPAFVLNEILGAGGFESRLMSEVREERGLTYGIGSYLVPKDHAALHIGQFASANDRVAEAVEVVTDEWARMVAEGVTEDELRRTITYLTGAYPLRFSSNAAIARILVGMQQDELSPDYVNTRNAQVEAVTLDDVARVAQRLMKPEALTFVVVGQPEGLETTVQP